MSRLRSAARVLVCAAALAVVAQPTASYAEPPGIPDPAAARTMLDGLTVAAELSMAGYLREEFPHWSTVSAGCTAREMVLQRDGSRVSVDAECRPTAGEWYSPYDEQTVTDSAEVDIDHMVPLAEAWRSGASGWTEDRREQFANDLDSPQLIAVTASSNRSKGDQDPADWQPPNAAYRCTYAAMWVAVKSGWGLTLQQAEKDTLTQVLRGC